MILIPINNGDNGPQIGLDIVLVFIAIAAIGFIGIRVGFGVMIGLVTVILAAIFLPLGKIGYCVEAIIAIICIVNGISNYSEYNRRTNASSMHTQKILKKDAKPYNPQLTGHNLKLNANNLGQAQQEWNNIYNQSKNIKTKPVHVYFVRQHTLVSANNINQKNTQLVGDVVSNQSHIKNDNDKDFENPN